MTNDTKAEHSKYRPIAIIFALCWIVTLGGLVAVMAAGSTERSVSQTELSEAQSQAEACEAAAESYRDSTLLLTESITEFVSSQFTVPLDLTPALESVNAGDDAGCLKLEE